MATIESINEQYIDLMNALELFQSSDVKIGVVQKSTGSTIDKISQSVKYLKELDQSTNCEKPAAMSDVIAIGECYLACVKAIEEYKNDLQRFDGTNQETVIKASEKVIAAQNRYDDQKAAFFRKYNYNIDSDGRINDALTSCTGSAISSVQGQINKLKDDIKEKINEQGSVELRSSMPIKQVKSLPTKFLIARCPAQKQSFPILRDIGILSSYKNIFASLRDQGNTILKIPYEKMGDEAVDDFVISYILQYIETFPLGNVNVHLFDENTNYLYKRLSNIFQSENAGEVTKRTIQIHSQMNDLSDFRDVICDDIFKKTSPSSPDLYSIYEHDSSDPFILIVLRDGLVDSTGYASADILDAISSLSKPGDFGHKCGLRFLILDNSMSFEKNLAPNTRHMIDQINQNCAVCLEYDGSNYLVDGKPVEVLHIAENLDNYVQTRSQALADIMNNSERSYVSLDEVSANTVENKLGAIMYIPVGKAGGDAIELPFSCKDENGTVAGACIGYMTIGQSGSGKSSFFHSLVLNGCMKYSPRDLQFWLLDFKNGGASSKYRDSGLPHIKMIAEDNKIDDALCLFQMVLEEMERRNKAFNNNRVDNIIDYNEIANAQGLEYFPRIIIAIDEVQEIFREDSASVLQKQISSISARMRSAGMHFVMVAQNLSDGKSYMLKEAFLPSATGRICFRVASDIPRDSGFGEDFVQRRQEIAELKTGEAYVGYGKDTIKKIKMAYISPQEMHDKYFSEICRKYPDFSDMKPLVIGSKQRISINSNLQGSRQSFLDLMRSIAPLNGMWSAMIGEDAYRMSPLSVRFSQNENSTVLLLGSDKQIASSLCASITLSLLRQNVSMHLFNGDRTKVQDGMESYAHAFMYLCQSIGDGNSLVHNHRMNELCDVLKEIYKEYLNRLALVQEAEDEDPVFTPIFLVINDLFAIESFANNVMIESDESEEVSNGPATEGFGLNYDIFDDSTPSSANKGHFRESVQNIVSQIVKSGWRYNIHAVLAIKGDPSTWRTSRVASEINNVVLFNSTEYADQFENSYYLKEMLKNVSNDGAEETMAVWSSHKTYSKIRPFIYHLSNEQEKNAVDLLVKGV